MGDDERRRYPRYAQYLPVRLKQGGKEVELITSDISRTGAFVVTDSPRLDRELLKLSLELPDGEEVDLMGMVSRRIVPTDPGGAQKPGMGIDFFAISEKVERRLKELIESIPDEDLLDLDPRKPPSDRPLPTRRRHARYLCRFLVRLKDRERLREFYSKDISAGGTFVKTPAPKQVNPEVELVLVHPQPPHEEFPISGRVMRVVEGPTMEDRGVAIEFTRLAAEVEASLLAFIETGVNYLRKSD
jgi:c-di-GMP-binding flagellar brake protein YcgR